jgi:excinuclease ABC subunit A
LDSTRYIRIRGARQHNLKDVTVDIPRDRLVVVTGLSGSGKSSLAFDTIHAEGQRKYIETLSAYARQFLEQLQKPDVEHIEGLPPTIAIEQRSGMGGPRSTVATTTEIYDYLRLLYARVGEPHCWVCGREIQRQSTGQIVDAVMALPEGSRVMVLAPLVRGQRGQHPEVFREIQRQGFVRVRVNNELYDIKGLPKLAKARKHNIEVVVDRLVIKAGVSSRLAESIELALTLGDETVFIAVEGKPGQWEDRVFSARFACPIHPEASLPELSPRLFSFNSPHGACPTCSGLGNILEFDIDLVVPDKSVSLAQGAIDAWRHGGKRLNMYYRKLLDDFCLLFKAPPDVPYGKLPEELRDILMHGTTPEMEAKYGAAFEGVLPNLKRRWSNTENEGVKHRLHTYLSERPCETCGGSRLRREALSVLVGGKNLYALTQMPVEAAHPFLSGLVLTGERAIVAQTILREILQRLKFMMDVGVGYLSLDRTSESLSGGEAQRIRLATQVGSGLVGVCYVLDEPTVGLHPRDSAQLIGTLRRLADVGNTVLVVEHDEETIRAADYILDMGPGAGAHGGQIVAQGPLDAILKDPASLTGQYLRGEVSIPVPERRRKVVQSQSVEIVGAAEHNLKNINVVIPLGCFVCVTGVSGSGKSTLVNEVFLKALRRQIYGSRERPGRFEKLIGATRVDKVVEIDQTPIGRTPRSNPVTYTKAFDPIRQLFSKTREAKLRGYTPSRFSFNIKGGRCEACQGQGTKRIEMHFLPDVYVECDVCKGARYNRETLEIRYRGKSIADVLEMRVDEAIPFFDSFTNIKGLLVALDEVGLSYMKLGQASNTLSGGEAQRVKLAAELGKPATGHTLYVLDEPTTGLHFADVHNLLRVLQRLGDKGHTLVVIEHNLEVIKVADWIIDLGPEGGDRGGQVVAVGRPEEVAKNPASYTGQFLRARLPLRPESR